MLTNGDGLHRYVFKIGERGGWADGLEDEKRFELKQSFREQLMSKLKDVSGPWSLDVHTLAQLHDIGSLHAIPEKVHRIVIDRWLRKLNDKKVGGAHPLSLGTESDTCCEYVPPRLWHACFAAPLRVGSDPKTARQWTIRAQDAAGKVARDIPVCVEISWVCEIEPDDHLDATVHAGHAVKPKARARK